MAGNILTPQALWGNFKVDVKPEAELITEQKTGDVIVSHVYIDGRSTLDGQVKIYGTIARNVQLAIMPAVLIVKDMETGAGDELGIELAKKGYLTLTIDLAGKVEGAERFTIYPEDVEYANYGNVKDNLTALKKGVKDSYWYEWGAAVRYAFEYLISQPCVNKIGAIGVKYGATLLWQLAGTDDRLSAFVAVMNAGWHAYKGQRKFAEEADTQMPDDLFKYVAGVEPQSYASNIKTPTLMLSATNSELFDADRAYDTVVRIKSGAYIAIDYSPNCVNYLDNLAYRDMLLFMDEFLMKGAKGEDLPLTPEIKCNVKDGKIEITVKADDTELAELSVYVAEGTETPELRCWKKVSGKDVNEKGHRVYYYLPYPRSGIITAFAKARYDNGFTVSSPIIAKRFKAEEIEIKHKERIVFSGREQDASSIFTETCNNALKVMQSERNAGVKDKNGPMGIAGVYAENGLLTFKINSEKDKPADGSILMLDVYVKADEELTVKLICDYFGAHTVYSCKVAVKGGKVWHNLKLEMNRFKTEEGKIIKSYEKVNAIEFSLSGTYIINNVLWI